MGGVYNFLLKISRFLRASAAKNNIQNDITLVDDLIQRANSIALEVHLMAHDAGVTSTELFTHLHMFRRRTFLESPTVDLPQRDKDRLLVMSVGGNDLFGPEARQIHEWKRDTEVEKIKLISKVFDECDQRDKAKKKPSSSECHPPRSPSHRSPLDSISRPKPKDSYNQQPGQSFRRPPKQSPYKSRTGTQSKNQTFTRDKDNAVKTGTPNLPSQLALSTIKVAGVGWGGVGGWGGGWGVGWGGGGGVGGWGGGGVGGWGGGGWGGGVGGWSGKWTRPEIG